VLTIREKREADFVVFWDTYRFLSISTAIATAMTTAIIIAITPPIMVMV
jgi:hypothetical protein